MKILHATKRYPNSLAGDAMVVSQLRKYQLNEGHEVFVLTSNCSEILNDRRVKKFGIPISSSAIDSINLKRIFTLACLLPWSFWYLRKVKPDLIHSHTMDFGFGLSFAARFYKIPIINTCHGVSFMDPSFSWLKRKLEIMLLKGAHYKLVLTVDENSLTRFRELGFEKIQYIPNAVDLERFNLAKPYVSGKFQLLFVGRLTKVKGVPILLEALARLPKYVDWELKLVGIGFKKTEYEKYAENAGIAKNVKFLGQLLPKKNAQLYSQSHIFILPSLHEGFPIVLLEAWAAQLPIIIAKVGTVTTVCTDKKDVVLINPGSSEELTNALLLLVHDKKLRQKIAINGRKNVEKVYNYHVLSKQVEEIYRDLIK